MYKQRSTAFYILMLFLDEPFIDTDDYQYAAYHMRTILAPKPAAILVVMHSDIRLHLVQPSKFFECRFLCNWASYTKMVLLD